MPATAEPARPAVAIGSRRVARAASPGPARATVSLSSAPGELDDERAHLGVLGPGRVDDVGRPEDRLAGRDPGPLVADADPAAALDDDELGRVRVGVRLDPGVPREGQLGDDPAAVGVDDLAAQPDRAGRTVRPPMADAEAADLDRHRPALG